MADEPEPGPRSGSLGQPLLLVDVCNGCAVGESTCDSAPESANRSMPDAAADWVPEEAFVTRFATLALASGTPEAAMVGVADGVADRLAVRHELSVRLVDETEGARLNREYRGMDHPTNVLSFGSGLPTLDGQRLLGDLVFCPTVIAHEAHGQGKTLPDHWAHLIVHGTLHLLGHDHASAQQAEAMEGLEIRLLSSAGIADPYRGAADDPDE